VKNSEKQCIGYVRIHPGTFEGRDNGTHIANKKRCMLRKEARKLAGISQKGVPEMAMTIALKTECKIRINKTSGGNVINLVGQGYNGLIDDGGLSGVGKNHGGAGLAFVQGCH